MIFAVLSVNGLCLCGGMFCTSWIAFSTGHGEYSYQPPPYGDQGYDRSFEESSQHYYEGGICLGFWKYDLCGSASACHMGPGMSAVKKGPGWMISSWHVRLPVGNSQYGQQQAQYQQGSGQQPFSQQQYSSQQGYGGQPQGYGEKAASLVRSRRHEHTLNLPSLLQLLARLPPPSTPSFSRVRANSTAPTALPREALEHSHRGPMLMSRYIQRKDSTVRL